MINTSAELNRLIEPLLARSSLSGLPNSFSDNAADLVLKRLGISASSTKHQASWASKNRLTWWVDEKAYTFFDHAPTAVGIEVNSGISTRFHRLSNRADWPRFNWLMVNTPNVDECLKHAFPVMDNFSRLAKEKPEIEWLEHLAWRGTSSALAIVGESKPLSKGQANELMNALSNAEFGVLKNLELIVFHRSDVPANCFRQNHLPTEVKDHYWANENTLLSGILQALFKKKKNSTCATHFKIQIGSGK